MVTINIVIGANYGDEGKGLVTNAITPKNGVVVLANGGAQRGHTVEYNGQKHVFHHFGSATLKGAASYASKTFILNPIQFNKEIQDFDKVKFYIDASCRITTIYDMMANAVRCQAQGTTSTGFGIKETLDRYASDKSWFRVLDYVVNDANWKEELIRIRNYYLQFDEIKNSILYDQFVDDKVLDRFIQELYTFFNGVSGIKRMYDIYCEYSNITIECGQGLALDTDYDIEYGTPTHTNSLNLEELLAYKVVVDNESRTKTPTQINRFYVSRTYLTRHGDGELPGEDKELKFIDETNIPNEFQGTIRFAPFTRKSRREMIERIRKDQKVSKFVESFKVNNFLVFTHTNERPVDRVIRKEFKKDFTIVTSKNKEEILYNI